MFTSCVSMALNTHGFREQNSILEDSVHLEDFAILP